jgi:hypothetical protein
MRLGSLTRQSNFNKVAAVIDETQHRGYNRDEVGEVIACPMSFRPGRSGLANASRRRFYGCQ